MRAELVKVIVAALLGGVITYVAGPIAKRTLEKHSYGSHWAGVWDTISCHEGMTYTRWIVTFRQDGDSVTGRYVGADSGTELYRGRMSGQVNLSQLKGDWSSHSIKEVIGGTFSFVMLDSGDAFEGTYLAGNTQRIWNGRRDGIEPNCF